MKGECNGDQDLGDGNLDKLKEEYLRRQEGLGNAVATSSLGNCQSLLKDLKDDLRFLQDGLSKAIPAYRAKLKNGNQ
jgi:hypothetical protein